MTAYKAKQTCTINYTHNPAWNSSEFDPGAPEEFYIDSFKVGDVELSEFLTDEMEEELYKLLKGSEQ